MDSFEVSTSSFEGMLMAFAWFFFKKRRISVGYVFASSDDSNEAKTEITC